MLFVYIFRIKYAMSELFLWIAIDILHILNKQSREAVQNIYIFKSEVVCNCLKNLRRG